MTACPPAFAADDAGLMKLRIAGALVPVSFWAMMLDILKMIVLPVAAA